MGQVHPVALEDGFHLQLEQVRVGEDVAAATEHARLRIVLDGGGKQLAKASCLVGHDGH